VAGLTNPSFGTYGVSIATKKSNSVVHFATPAFSITTISAPTNMKLNKLVSTSNSIQEKSDYTFCFSTDQPISLTDEVQIQFPK
jgi:hypothetical protein